MRSLLEARQYGGLAYIIDGIDSNSYERDIWYMGTSPRTYSRFYS